MVSTRRTCFSQTQHAITNNDTNAGEMNELMADMENFVNTQRECPSSSDESSADGEDDDEDQENKIEEQTNQTTRATDVAGVHAPLADISNFPLTQDTADAAASLLSLVNKPPRPAAVPLETTTPPAFSTRVKLYLRTIHRQTQLHSIIFRMMRSSTLI
jgi:hypothetical protein